MEKGISAYNLAIDWLDGDAIESIRAILDLISDQFSDNPTKHVDECMGMVKQNIQSLASNEHKDKICDIFKGLRDIQPRTAEVRTITAHRCTR